MAPKKKKKGKAAPTLLKVEGSTDRVKLKLTWEGGAAALASLTDNGDPVDFSRDTGLGKAGLDMTWNSPRAFLHVLQWDLWFEGTRTKLKAVATINGTGGFENPVASKSEDDRWSASGTATE